MLISEEFCVQEPQKLIIRLVCDKHRQVWKVLGVYWDIHLMLIIKKIFIDLLIGFQSFNHFYLWSISVDGFSFLRFWGLLAQFLPRPRHIGIATKNGHKLKKVFDIELSFSYQNTWEIYMFSTMLFANPGCNKIIEAFTI